MVEPNKNYRFIRLKRKSNRTNIMEQATPNTNYKYIRLKRKSNITKILEQVIRNTKYKYIRLTRSKETNYCDYLKGFDKNDIGSTFTRQVLWLSTAKVKGTSWFAYANKGPGDWGPNTHIIGYDLDLSKLLIIDTPVKLIKFQSKYSTHDQYYYDLKVIKWGEVAADGYSGIVLYPRLIKKNIRDLEYRWYFAFDADTIAIWNCDAIMSYEVIYDPTA